MYFEEFIRNIMFEWKYVGLYLIVGEKDESVFKYEEVLVL